MQMQVHLCKTLSRKRGGVKHHEKKMKFSMTVSSTFVLCQKSKITFELVHNFIFKAVGSLLYQAFMMSKIISQIHHPLKLQSVLSCSILCCPLLSCPVLCCVVLSCLSSVFQIKVIRRTLRG